MKAKFKVLLAVLVLLTLSSCSNIRWSATEGLQFRGNESQLDYQIKYRENEKFIKAEKSF